MFILIFSLFSCMPLPSPVVDSSIAKSGDIIFQVSTSSQAKAVAIASSSMITHVGIISVKNNKVTVIEAVEPVREISIEEFKKHGSFWGISRLKTEPKTKNWASKVINAARRMKGKHYDLLFKWNSDKIYCSELVWKAFKTGAGIELVTPQRFKDLNLSSPAVKSLIKSRLGNKEVDLNEQIVTPGHLHDSDLLENIYGFLP